MKTKTLFKNFLLSASICAPVTFFAPNVFALNPNKAVPLYVHNARISSEGLPQDSVNAAAQTADGYLWLATQ